MLSDEQRIFLLPKAYNAAIRAGAVILDLYNEGENKNSEINLKSDSTPVTLADMHAHTAIKDYLSKTHIPILSEEGREMLYVERAGWDFFWLVDPLDGTKEFLKRNGEFTVSIALMIDGQAEIGVIYVPYLSKMYFADAHNGSFVKLDVKADVNAEFTYDQIISGGQSLPLKTEVNSPVRVGVSRSHINELTYEYLDKLKLDHQVEVVVQGSSYKFCLLAEGTLDYYVRTTFTYEWDTAAGELILRVAGGSTKVLDTENDLTYNKESLLNPHFVCRSKFFK